MKNVSNLLWGLVFVALGLIWGINALGIAEINVFFDGWWTLIIIIPSAIGLLKSYNKTANLVMLIVGIVLLLSAQDIVSFSTVRKLLLPMILVIIGLSIMFGQFFNEKISKKIRELNKSGLIDYTATFSAQKAVLQNEVFEGANIDAIFGGVELDIRNAQIVSEKVINATAVFGGIEIYIPNNVNVKVKSTPIFGGVTNKTIQYKGEGIPTIYINAFCLFGGVDIK
jgi:predicted membrane protein